MGQIIKKTSNYLEILKKSNIPIILCSPTEKVITTMCFDNPEKPWLNILLAEKLLSYPQEQRWQKAYEEAKSILLKNSTSLFLENFEMLFNPKYEIDIIKLFYEISKNRRIIIKWCGEVNGDCLTFASPEHKDYHSYNIKNYDITCII